MKDKVASDWATPLAIAFEDVRRRCHLASWDGEGAKPITQRTIATTEIVATALQSMLAKGTPAPDVIPEADGDLCLNWSPDEHKVFSVSLGDHGNANFAGQLGREGGRHGWQPISTSDRTALEDSLRDIAEHIDRLHRHL